MDGHETGRGDLRTVLPRTVPPQKVLHRLVAGERLDEDEAEALFSRIMQGEVEPVELAAILTALRMRGETEAELRGAVRAVRACMTALEDVPEGAIDVCGTGGDGLGTLNVSTAVAFVLAGLGVPVAKHGNRALSSRSGATDVLQMLGIEPEGDAALQSERLRRDGVAFLAAPLHHPAMRHAAGVRKALGFRTVFNLLGPLCNPARVRRQMVGVFDAVWLDTVARTLGALGGTCIWAVHGETDRGGADELTLAGPGRVSAWDEGDLRHFHLEPEMAGFPRRPIAELAGGAPGENATALRALLGGARGVYRDTVLLNAAVALHVAGVGPIVAQGRVCPAALKENVARAASSLDSGAAAAALKAAAHVAAPVE